MSHKQQCITSCKDHLQSRNLGYVFNEKVFNSTYTKFNGANKNALSMAMRAADAMIMEYKPNPEEFSYYTEFFN